MEKAAARQLFFCLRALQPDVPRHRHCIFTQSANHCSLKVINFLKKIKINPNEKYNTGVGNSGLLSSAVFIAGPATPAASPNGRALHPERMP